MNEESLLETNQHPSVAPDPVDDDVDAVYEAFLPHLISARRSYVRRRLGVVLLLPIILIAGVAWASTDEAPAQVATETELEEPSADRSTDDDEEEERATEDADPVDDAGDDLVATADDAEAEAMEPAWESVELGFLGTATVAVVDGQVVLGELSLAPGWEGHALALGSGEELVIHLTNGAVKLLATIGGDLRAELTDVTPEPEPEVETRKEIAVGDVATVVVERDGERLVMVVTWSHEWWKATVVTPEGARVYATFDNDGVVKHVEAWIDGDEIAHGVWVTEPAADKDGDGEKESNEKTEKDTDKDTDKKTDKDEEPEIQTRKEIHVGEVGKVVVERDGEKLWLGVLWSHEHYDAVVVVDHGKEVHAYFTNDGVEHHVRAWIKGPYIKHEKWVVEPEIAPYDGTVGCGFGNVGILVEGHIARVMSVQEVEGVEWQIDKEVGEVVKVRFFADGEEWLMEAWGTGDAVVAECGQVG